MTDPIMCGWTWTHWMGGPNRQECYLPFGHAGMHRMLNEQGETVSAAPEGFPQSPTRGDSGGDSGGGDSGGS